MNRAGILRGMSAGLIAAGVMSLARLLAHRAGLVERTVPQILQERAAGEAGIHLPGGTAGHQLSAEVIHYSVGLAAGGLLGALSPRPRSTAAVVYGLAIWLAEAWGLLPALRVRRLGAVGLAVDAAAHALFGFVLAFTMRELAAQDRLRPAPTKVPLLRRVG
jgi:hypothetical protein